MTLLSAAVLPPEATAQSISTAPNGFAFSAVIPVSAGGCHRQEPDVPEWAGYARPTELRHVAFRGPEKDTAGMQYRAARTGLSGVNGDSADGYCGDAPGTYDAAVRPVSFPGQAVKFSGGNDIGMFSLQSLAGFGGENLKLKLSSRSVKLRFRLRF